MLKVYNIVHILDMDTKFNIFVATIQTVSIFVISSLGNVDKTFLL